MFLWTQLMQFWQKLRDFFARSSNQNQNFGVLENFPNLLFWTCRKHFWELRRFSLKSESVFLEVRQLSTQSTKKKLFFQLLFLKKYGLLDKNNAIFETPLINIRLNPEKTKFWIFSH